MVTLKGPIMLKSSHRLKEIIMKGLPVLLVANLVTLQRNAGIEINLLLLPTILRLIWLMSHMLL
jgi:hypothetical protein